jgi:Flp pilus assembly pilin Flp
MTNSGPTITQKPVEHKRLSDFLLDESGLTITEYAIAAGLIAAAIAGAFGVLGTTIDARIVAAVVSL